MKTLNYYFNSVHSTLGIRQQLTQQRVILERLRTLLPPPMGEHCIGAIQKNSDLILHVDSPVWASRLRYLSTELKQQLRQERLIVRHIRVKVALPHQHAVNGLPKQRIKPLSSANAKIIRSMAEYLEDPALKMALLRLSKHSTE